MNRPLLVQRVEEDRDLLVCWIPHHNGLTVKDFGGRNSNKPSLCTFSGRNLFSCSCGYGLRKDLIDVAQQKIQSQTDSIKIPKHGFAAKAANSSASATPTPANDPV